MEEDDRADLRDDLVDSVAALLPVPLLGAAAKGIARALTVEWTRNRSVALRAAKATSGMTRETLAEQIKDDPRLVPLLTRVLFAAGQNGHDRTLRAMGTVLGDAIRQRDRLDEREAILASLADLGAAHVRVLELLVQQPPPALPGEPPLWSRQTIGAAADLPASLALLVPAALISRGLAEQPAMVDMGDGTMLSGHGNEAMLEITALGRLVLEVLQQWKAAAQ